MFYTIIFTSLKCPKNQIQNNLHMYVSKKVIFQEMTQYDLIEINKIEFFKERFNLFKGSRYIGRYCCI